MEINSERIGQIILNRAYRLKYDNVYQLINGRPFILAGGALGAGKPNDFDIYPHPFNEFSIDGILGKLRTQPCCNRYELVCHTKNALTVRVDDQILQFCHYSKPTVEKLVRSFDFAHCQVAVEFAGDGNPPHLDGVEFTEDYLVSKATENTFYTGSEYPTASLIRSIKYAKRGEFCGKSYVTAILRILGDIIERGYKNYSDFKDQLDAIDLGLTDSRDARDLFEKIKDTSILKEHS